MSKGFIYILKNPSFPNYIKIGYADNVEERLKELNRSECIPFAFRIYATYEVNNRLMDLKLHAIIDKLNPNLRSKEIFKGKERVREFYAMSAEEAFEIFEAIAEINGCTDKLKKWQVKEEDAQNEKIAEKIEITVAQERKARHSNYTFDDWQIPLGAVLENTDNVNIKCTVVNRRQVEYNGEIMYMTTLAKRISGNDQIVHGPGYICRHFKYNGELIEDIEKRIRAQDTPET